MVHFYFPESGTLFIPIDSNCSGYASPHLFWQGQWRRNGFRGWSNAGLLDEPTRGGNGVLHQRPVNLRGGCCYPAEAVDFVQVFLRQVEWFILK